MVDSVQVRYDLTIADGPIEPPIEPPVIPPTPAGAAQYLSFIDCGETPALGRLYYRPVYPQSGRHDGSGVAGRPGRHGRHGPVRKKREKLIVRVDGEEIEVKNVTEFFDLLRKIKRDAAKAAKARASEIVKTGESVVAARAAEPPIEVVSAPPAAKAAIEKRIEEVDQQFWEATAEEAERLLKEDDEEVMMLIQSLYPYDLDDR